MRVGTAFLPAASSPAGQFYDTCFPDGAGAAEPRRRPEQPSKQLVQKRAHRVFP
jgi:hypothetical protein